MRNIFDITPERAAKTLREYGFAPEAEQHSSLIERHKVEVLARPESAPYTDAPPELKTKRLDNLKRRLQSVQHYEQGDY